MDDDEMVVALVAAGLSRAGHRVLTAGDGRQALEQIDAVLPDVVVCDVNMPGLDGFAFAQQLRATPSGRTIPLIFLTSRQGQADVLKGLRLGADDYVSKPFMIDELVARVNVKMARRPVPVELLDHDLRSGVLTEQRLREIAGREQLRAVRTGRPGFLGVLEIAEAVPLRDRFGPTAIDSLARQLAAALAEDAAALEEVGHAQTGRFLILLPEMGEDQAAHRLAGIARRVAGRRMTVHGEAVWTTPVIGYAAFSDSSDTAELVEKAVVAAEHAVVHLDARPVRWTGQMAALSRRRMPKLTPDRLRTPGQVLLTLVLGLVLPFFVYWGVGHFYDISGVAYLVVVASLLITAATIWLEGFLALSPPRPPPDPRGASPPASAIIAAYLPNEAPIVMETVDAFLAVDYEGPLQIILAYNTPRPLAVESALLDVAKKDPRFVPFKVEGSTSKAQNVNAALHRVKGEFVGIFDADHCPQPDSFRRAWRWIAGGYDVVQGHSVVRNGDASWVARTVAVEFESIYAVSHPGRTRLHDFGIFGGSNGYWRSSLLRAIRMRGSMLTEDIDSALRAVEEGARITSDPLLVSRELAPITLGALWNQRMRWAQGWFQVSLRHLLPGLRSPNLSVRQKWGFAFLLGWREIYPWVSLQIFPLIAYQAYTREGLGDLDWFIAIFVLTTLFTVAVGPGQTLFAYICSDRELRRHKGWFWWYLVVASIFYTELKNIIARVAQIKEAMRERAWKITPRTEQAETEDASASASPSGQEPT
ncbi:response regulator [Streptomyces sp. NPDC086081]|uniref:response regulator n=1 Tax=Streptomyces sp. NPDC086081 TaxID=3365749 RepID=UPI0037F6EE17